MPKHYCSSCGKSWDCPQGNECEHDEDFDISLLCSRCLNKSKSTPKFGDKS